MARAFASASSQYLVYSGAVVSSLPFTLACWSIVPSTTTANTLMSLHANTDTGDYLRLGIRTAALNSTITAQSNDVGVGFGLAETSIGQAVNVWTHAVGVFASATSRTAYINGGSSGSNTTNSSPTVSVTEIGRFRGAGAGAEAYLNGSLSDAAIWNVALSAADIAALAAGWLPTKIRPDALVAYWPLGGLFGQTDNDAWKNKYHMTAVGSPTWSDHKTGLIYPRRRVA